MAVVVAVACCTSARHRMRLIVNNDAAMRGKRRTANSIPWYPWQHRHGQTFWQTNQENKQNWPSATTAATAEAAAASSCCNFSAAFTTNWMTFPRFCTICMQHAASLPLPWPSSSWKKVRSRRRNQSSSILMKAKPSNCRKMGVS